MRDDEARDDEARDDEVPGDGDEARPSTLGELIRRQRELAELPMRQLAKMVGISNPYLSQIERDLRAPSERVLAAIADSLQLSADVLFSRVGAGEGQPAVLAAINEDPDLTRPQRAALAEMYEACRECTRARRRRPGLVTEPPAGETR